MHKKKLSVLIPCIILILALSNCLRTKHEIRDERGEDFAGSASCQSCHKDVCSTYALTAHHFTSSPASKETIKGSFASDSNTVYYRPALKVVMEQTDSGFYQAAYLDNERKQAAKFDMVMGSGRKGQSYLSWLDSTIFQLPVSYFAPANTWVNSPGYPPKYILFNRNIPVGCFECHSSYINRVAVKTSGSYLIDYFDKKQIIYGIDCERCHGAAAAHVKYHKENPSETKAKFISSIASFGRQQQLDMCAMCHSGARQTKASSFHYKPGDKMSDYLKADTSTLRAGDIDVHGKQYQLLLASQCFIKSGTLTCITCHNPHKDEHNNLRSFSARCIACHANPDHTSLALNTPQQAFLKDNCIDCHMPVKPSNVIAMKSTDANDSVAAMVRSHYISVYKEVSQQYLKKR